jgi:hypothetical protein
MIKGFSDVPFAIEPVEEDRVAFHFGVGNFDGDGLSGAGIGGAKNGRHPTAGNDTVDAVMVELFAGMDWDSLSARAAAGQI